MDEPEAEHFVSTISLAPSRLMSVASYLETAIVLESRRGDEGAARLDRILAEARIELVPVSVEQAHAARETWRRYGKGNHPAALNFGDCFSYALAETTGEPLLYKGNDFAQTDISTA